MNVGNEYLRSKNVWIENIRSLRIVCNMQMNSLTGKKILSLLREGDYAHAGGEEAILQVFSKISKDPNRSLLDVGCGIGGTAHFLNQNGWGNVLGLDIDPDNISFAHNKYSQHEFIECDVVNASQKLKRTFDIMYCINSFYAFPDKITALKSLRRLASEKTQLIIFDYVLRQGTAAAVEEGVPTNVSEQQLRSLLESTGWTVMDTMDVSSDYDRWYSELVLRIHSKKEQITKQFGADWFEYVVKTYSNILTAIREGRLGGVIVTVFPQSISRS